MKKGLLVIILLSALCPVLAQVAFKLPFVPETDGKKLSNTDFDVYTLTSENSPYLVAVLQDKKKIEYALVSCQFKLVDTFRNAEIPAKTIYGSEAVSLGGLINDKVCYHIMKDEGSKSWFKKKNPVLAAEKIDFVNHTSSIQNVYELGDNEVLASVYPYQNQLYLLVAQKQSNDNFKIIRIDSSLQRSEQNIKVDMSELLEGAETLASYLASTSVIYGEHDNPSDKYLSTTKLYPRGDSIIMSFDKNKKPSFVLTIDLKKGTSSSHTISYSDLCGYADKKINARSASVYYDNLLFVANACKKKLELVVIDPVSGKQNGKIELNSGDNLNKLANGNVTSYQIIKGKKGDETYLESADQLIGACLSSPIAIKVEGNDKGQYVVNVIAQKQATRTMNVPLPIAGAGGRSGGLSYAATLTANVGIKMKMADSYDITSFKTLMAPSTFEHLKGTPKAFAFDKIKDRYFMEQKVPESLSVLYLGSDYYFGYYDEESQRYVIKKVK